MYKKNRYSYRQTLIRLVREHEHLWNHMHEQFMSREQKDYSWSQISRELGDHPITVRRCWDNLRDQYRRDLKREILTGTSSKWVFYAELGFLRPMIKIRFDKNDQKNETLTPNKAENIATNSGAQQEHLVPLAFTENMENAVDFNFQPVKISTEWKQQSNESHYTSFPNHEIDTQASPPNFPIQNEEICKTELKEVFNSIENDSLAFESAGASNQHFVTSIVNRPGSYSASGKLSSSESEAFPRTKFLPSVKRRKYSRSTAAVVDSANAPVQDEHYHFLMSLLPSLRQIPRGKVLPMRAEIMNLISKELPKDS